MSTANTATKHDLLTVRQTSTHADDFKSAFEWLSAAGHSPDLLEPAELQTF
jgi:hypothetical protein